MKAMIGISVVFLLANGFTQESPFIPATLDTALRNELSGEIAFDNLRTLTLYHRPDGSIGLKKALQFMESKALDYGLEDVRLGEQPFNGQSYEPVSAELWMVKPRTEKLASFADVALSLVDNSRTTHCTAELVDVGDGDAQKWYEGKDVKGKIVLASANPGAVMPLAVWKFGALGVVSYVSKRIGYLPCRVCRSDAVRHLVLRHRLPFRCEPVGRGRRPERNAARLRFADSIYLEVLSV